MDKKQSKKRKNKKKYFQPNKKFKSNYKLDCDMKGYLLTHVPKREKDSTFEAYNMLNKCADKLCGPEKFLDDFDDDDDDVEAQIAKVNEQRKSAPRRFQKIDTKCPNTLFIQTQIDEPENIATKIFEELLDDSESYIIKNLIRLYPISITCKAFPKAIESAITNLLKKFEDRASNDVHYMICTRRRQNNEFNEDEVQKGIIAAVKTSCPGWVPDFKGYELTFIIEVFRNICCMGILENYNKFRKYNLVEVTKPVEAKLMKEDNLEDKPSIEDNSKDEALSNDNISKMEIENVEANNTENSIGDDETPKIGIEDESIKQDNLENESSSQDNSTKEYLNDNQCLENSSSVKEESN